MLFIHAQIRQARGTWNVELQTRITSYSSLHRLGVGKKETAPLCWRDLEAIEY
jgi:hypothetical protein